MWRKTADASPHTELADIHPLYEQLQQSQSNTAQVPQSPNVR